MSRLDTWPVVEDMLRREGIARQHLNSYNEFVDKYMKDIVEEVGRIDIEVPGSPYSIILKGIRIGKPMVVELDGSRTLVNPQYARLRNLTYAAPLELETVIVDGMREIKHSYSIGSLPVMVRSKYCNLHGLSEKELIENGEDPKDPGGYFIINGSERLIVGLEDLSPNKIIVEKEKVGQNYVYRAQIYSSIIGYRAKTEIVLKHDGNILVKIPGAPVELPFVVVARALGLESDKEIAESVSAKPEVQDELEIAFGKASKVLSTRDAIVYIGNRVAHGMLEEFRIRRAENLLDWGLLPHLGREPENRRDKAMFLGEAVCKLLELKLGWIDPDDRDHYGNKVIRLAGQLLADLFRTAFRNLVRDMKYQLERMGMKRSPSAIGSVIRPGIISDKLKNALATGNWGRGKVGVTQLLDRTNYLSTLSHLRRIQSPLSRSQANFEARDLHPTHFGRVCPVETPEGSNCGLVKNLAMSAIISVSVPPEPIIDRLYELGVRPFEEAEEELKRDGCKVFVNGKFLGFVRDGKALADSLRKERRANLIHPHVSIYLYEPKNPNAYRRLYVFTYAGRVLRPLIVVEDGKPKLTEEHVEKVKKGELTFYDLVNSGIVELIDANEEENLYIALDEEHLTKEHTHLELYPPAILGVSASVIPYPEHNQSPRNTYEAAMAKQALGFSIPNYPFNTYVRQHLLIYPQKPLVRTRMSSLLNLDERPIGQNFIVAVISFSGYNVEDAVIINKSSVDRGLARSIFYRLYEAEAKQHLGGMRDQFEIPSPESNIRGYRGEKYYRLLESDGVIAHEAVVGGGDVLIGRTSPPRFMEEYREFEIKGPYRRDTSVAMRPSEKGVVESVFLTKTLENEKLYKVRVRDLRIPEIGDKFASRHGQKGVIGLLVDQVDMPYTEDGIVPDLIINPHAFPSRMTVGQFIESIAGKVAALEGRFVDGTPFLGEKCEQLSEALERLGFKRTGREVMYDGRTGLRYPADIFIGIVYYQKLHHMVADKIHARARGQIQMLTKQPTEGRARGGGLRFGEMERDCLVAYGASMLLKDRLLDESDKTKIYVCENCGSIAYYDVKQHRYVCRLCGDKAKVSPVVVSYAFKLLLQEVMSLCIMPRLILADKV